MYMYIHSPEKLVAHHSSGNDFCFTCFPRPQRWILFHKTVVAIDCCLQCDNDVELRLTAYGNNGRGETWMQNM